LKTEPKEHPMLRRNRLHFHTGLLVALGAFFLGNAPGCSDEPAAAPDPRFADVSFRNGATDEALGAMIAQTPLRDPTRSPELSYPTRGAHVPVAPAVVFRWRPLPGVASREPLRLDAPWRPSTSPPAWSPFLLAHAHGPALSGAAYLLVLQTPREPEFRRVFTTETSYQPDEETWAILRGLRAAITVSVTGATFEGNGLKAGPPVLKSDTFPFYIGEQLGPTD